MSARSRGPRRDFWRSAQWPILWILAGLSVVLGYVGFARYFRAAGETHSAWDLLYYALQLFPLQSGALAGPLPWPLQVARFLAPLVGIYTATQALAQIFRRQLLMMRVRWYRGHVVICGLGRKGMLLAKAFRERGERVVAVELDEDNDLAESCRAAGVRVFLGDATDPVLLRQVGTERARQVIAICGNDEVNAEIAVRVRALAAERGGAPLTCVVHVFDPEIWALLREKELMEAGEDRFQLVIFNIFESGAAAMLDEPPWRQGAAPPPHLLVVGLGQLGESLVLQAAAARPAAGDERLRVTVVDHDARRKCEALALRVPHLARRCDLVPCQIDARSPELERAGFAFDAGRCTLAAAYVCLDDEAAGLAAALALHRGLRGFEVPIVVRMEEESGLATLLTGAAGRGGRFEQLFGFGLLERTCRPDQLRAVSRETLARAMHDAYVREQQRAGESAPSNPSLATWEALSEEARDSNRRQAADVGRKLAAIGCELRAVRGGKVEPFTLEPGEVELVARMEHARWLDEKRSLHWTYAPGPRDAVKRTNPNLLEWAALGEETREANRRAAREMPAFLAGIGFEIRRLPARGSAARRGR